MKTTNEIKKELELTRAQEEAAKNAWVATRTKDGQLVFNNTEYRTLVSIQRKIEVLENELTVAERFEVKVGDGVTYRLYSDAQACTVIKRTAKSITIQEDEATLDPNFKPEIIAGGFVGHCVNQNEQTYTYKANPNGRKITARWSEKYGAFMYCGKAIFNGRHQFYDYNF